MTPNEQRMMQVIDENREKVHKIAKRTEYPFCTKKCAVYSGKQSKTHGHLCAVCTIGAQRKSAAH